MAGFCEHDNEPSGSIRKQDIFDKLSDNQLFSLAGVCVSPTPTKAE
jgi:hypothetical protein